MLGHTAIVNDTGFTTFCLNWIQCLLKFIFCIIFSWHFSGQREMLDGMSTYILINIGYLILGRCWFLWVLCTSLPFHFTQINCWLLRIACHGSRLHFSPFSGSPCHHYTWCTLLEKWKFTFKLNIRFVSKFRLWFILICALEMSAHSHDQNVASSQIKLMRAPDTRFECGHGQITTDASAAHFEEQTQFNSFRVPRARLCCVDGNRN